jgi:hypothetical protein
VATAQKDADPADRELLERVEKKLDRLIEFQEKLLPYLPVLERFTSSPVLKWTGLSKKGANNGG